MTLDHNDWRLTAYALGELDDADRADVEAAIAASPELARTIDEIRAIAGLLQAALAVETERHGAAESTWIGSSGSPRRLPADRDPLPSVARSGSHRGIRRLFLPFAAAASIVLALGVGWLALVPSLSRSREAVSLSSMRTIDPARSPRERSKKDGNIAHEEDKRASGARFYGFNPTAMAGPPAASSNGTAPSGQYLAFGLQNPNGLTPEASEKLRSLGYLGSEEGTPENKGTLALKKGLPAPSDVRARELAEYIRQRPEQGVHQQVAQNAAAPNYPKCESTGFDQMHPVNDWSLSASADGGGVMAARDFTQYENISFGYQLPYGPQNVQMPEDTRNRLVFGNDKGPFQSRVTHISPYEIDRLIEQLSPPESPGFEDYRAIQENPFRLVENDPLSTFSIDVDTASYANVRRYLTNGFMPPPDAVRIEEMINYFDYAYPQPVDEHPFAVHVEVAQCPWNGAHRLARIGIKGYEIAPQDRPPANLVFLIDVSGSMQPANKLPLLREALSLMVDELNRDDYVGIVVYAGASGIVLSPTNNKDVIRGSINGLMAGGGTNGAAGIEAAYQLAEDTFVPGGINRVILATDGDFNVGVTGSGDLQRLIEEKAKSGVFLTVLGFGMGNLKDGTLETLADKGNGNYAYIDTLSEAQKVLIEQMEGTLVTIAKDVKIQVEFNPLAASAYRLIGYENRMLAAQDFNDDKKDAGEIGAGHTVTALYEIVPVGQEVDVPLVDELKYQAVTEFTPAADSGELMTVKLRYKEPEGEVSKLIEVPVLDGGTTFAESSDDFAFAASVAAFGMLLRHSQYVGSIDYAAVAEFAAGAKGPDFYGYRAEFIELVRKAESLGKAP